MTSRPDSDPSQKDAPEGEELAEEVRELREKNKDAEPTQGFPGDPQAGAAGPGATSSKD